MWDLLFPIVTEPPYDLLCIRTLEALGVIPVYSQKQRPSDWISVWARQWQWHTYNFGCSTAGGSLRLLYGGTEARDAVWGVPRRMASTSDLKLMLGFTCFAF